MLHLISWPQDLSIHLPPPRVSMSVYGVGSCRGKQWLRLERSPCAPATTPPPRGTAAQHGALQWKELGAEELPLPKPVTLAPDDQYGYGSIPINSIFSGMNIHLPAILMWTTGVQGFDTLPYDQWMQDTPCWLLNNIYIIIYKLSNILIDTYAHE